MKSLLRQFIAAMALVQSAGGASGEPLRLSVDWVRVNETVEVVVAATNDGADDLEICGRWRLKSVYLAGAAAKARADSLRAVPYTRCSTIRLPVWVDGRIPDLDPAPYLHQLAPGQSLIDTARFWLPVAPTNRETGTVEIWYYLDLCDAGADPERIVPWNGAGGAVVAVIPVP